MALPGLTIRPRGLDVMRVAADSRTRDIAAVASYVLLALWVTSGLWLHRSHGVAENIPDQALFEVMFSHGAQVLAHGQNPFHSYVMGTPVGMNMMANTSVLGITLPLAPVTLLLGPRASFDLAVFGSLAGTAIAWYLVASRVLVRSRAAGWVCGLICGFGPAMITHSNAHLHLTGQILIPVILWRSIKLCESDRWVRNGLWLALVVTWQFFVSGEVLLLAVIAIGIGFAVLGWLRPELRQAWRPLLSGLLVTGAVCVVVLAYPLWKQFRGAGSYDTLLAGLQRIDADPLSFVAFSRLSLAGSSYLADHLAPLGPREENTFLGLSLVVLLVVAVILMRRRAAVIALAVVAAVAAICSLGSHLLVWGHRPGVTLPWHFIQKLPVLGSIVPSRWGLVLLWAAGLLVALLVAEYAGRGPKARAWLVGGLIVALVPIFPKPLPTVAMKAPPAFITNGAWRTYTAGGRTLMFLPVVTAQRVAPVRWTAEQNNQIRLAQGYFLGEGPTGIASIGAPPRWLDTHFRAMATGEEPPYAAFQRVNVIKDLNYWHVGAVVLLPVHKSRAYRRAMTEMLGFGPKAVGGVKVWDVRALTSGRP